MLTVRCLSSGHAARPAEYRWFTHGFRYGHFLCERCCAGWLANALTDDELMPDGVELVASIPWLWSV